MVPLPAQHHHHHQQQQQPQPQQRQRSISVDQTDHYRQQQQQQEPEAVRGEVDTDVTWYSGNSDRPGEPRDVYENINMCIETANVFKAFDDAITESEVTTSTADRRQPSTSARTRRQSSQDDATNMLSQAERAMQKLIQQRNGESSTMPDAGATEDRNVGAVVLRPVPTQRSAAVSSDPQAEQFKQLLAAKVASRRLPEDAVVDQNGRPTPVPVGRPVVARATSVDDDAVSAPTKMWKPPASAKPKTKSVALDDVNNQQLYSEPSRSAGRQRPSVEIGRHQLPPSPPASSSAAAPQMISEDLPPPPEEYCNLPPMNSRPTSAPSRGLPPTTNDYQLADWQREIADKFHHHHPTTTTAQPLSIADLPPPPSGFHDDIPVHPGHSRAQPPPFRQPSVGGLAGNAGGLAGTDSDAMSGWSRDEVVEWLKKQLGMPEHCNAFWAAGVDGQTLVHLTDDQLYALGVKQFGQRRMMRRAIESRGDDS